MKKIGILFATVIIMLLFVFTASAVSISEVPEGYVGIYNVEDFNDVRNDLTANYILMNDIDLSQVNFSQSIGVCTVIGWCPIGVSSNYYGGLEYKEFTGVFDGNGYSVKNVKTTITIAADNYIRNNYIGLFAVNSGTIKNLTVSSDIIFSGSYNTLHAGLICGKNTSIIENCHASGNISANLNYDNGMCISGGICGTLQGGCILNCSSNTDINSYSCDVRCGGIVGAVDQIYDSIIQSCYNTGDIVADCGYGGYIGGIVGRTSMGGTSGTNIVSIINCYNTGTLIGTGKRTHFNFGGISAEYHKYNIIENCYNIGNVPESTESYGAIVANAWCGKDNIDISTCYYLDSSCEYAVNTDVGLTDGFKDIGNKLNSFDMKIEESFNNFDFENVWIVDAKSDYPYPQLINNLQSNSKPVRHSYSEMITKESTCTEVGIKTFICSDCDFSFNVETQPKGHKYDKTVTFATCTTQGYTTYACECGEAYTVDYINAKGHNHTSQITTQPTHLTEGEETFTCACGDSYTKPIAKISEHNYTVLNFVAPTCETEGYTMYHCECGHTYSEKKSATGHNYNGDYCTECGESRMENCSCNCHKGGIMGFFWKLINFFNKLFNSNKTCACGVAHY